MVYKRYSSPFEETRGNAAAEEIIRPHPEVSQAEPPKEKAEPTPDYTQPNPTSSLGFLDNMAYDDIILIGLIVILLAENKESRDVPLILTLGFLFLIQYIDAD